MPSPGAHYRPTTADVPDGVYRVVGADDDIALLRVGDTDGERVHTGEVHHVETLDGFERAEPPASNRSLAGTIGGVLRTGYWSVRAFLLAVLARPLSSGLALVVMVAAGVGERTGAIPELVGTLLTLAGALWLAAIGSGRL
jgi:hypothetical protein